MSNIPNHTALLPLPLDDKTNLLLQEGIAWLFNRNAFWAAVLSSPNLRLGLVPPALEDQMTTAATDGFTTIWLNKKFFDALFKLADTAGVNKAGVLLYVVLHEAAHILADHTNERINSHMKEHNVRAMSVDYQVHDILAKDGFMHPAIFDACPIDEVWDKKRKSAPGKFPFFGDTNMRTHCADADDVIKIYDYLLQQQQQNGGGGSGSDGSGDGVMHADVQPENSPGNQPGVQPENSPDNQPGGQDDGEGDGDEGGIGAGAQPQPSPQQARDDMLADAVMAAKTIGNMSYAAERAANALTKSRTPWQKQLTNLMSASASRAQERKRTFRRIGRRTQAASTAYAVKPGRIRDPKPGVLLVADCSGSISTEELHKFAAECEGILASGKVGFIRVIYCDTVVTDNGECFKPRDNVVLKPTRSGGTDFEPVWHWQRKHMPDAAAIVYLTDLYGEFGDKSTWPKVPVIWGATTPMHPPFGKAVRINQT